MNEISKDFIRNIIVYLREEGKTYQEISDELKNRFNIKKSRQAIQGIYSRHSDKEAMSGEKIRLACDVLGIYNLGYNLAQVKNKLLESGVDVGYAKISTIVKENMLYLDSVEETTLSTVVDLFNSENDPSIIRDKVSYMGIPMTDEKFGEYLIKAYKILVTRFCNEKAARVVQLSGNIGIVPDIVNTNITATKEGIKLKL